MKTSILAVALGLCVCSCGNYKPVTNDVNFQDKGCLDLRQYISTHWLKQKNKLLYKHRRIKKEEFESKMNTTYKECFFSLSINDVKHLFGEPNEEIPNELVVYYMSEGCTSKREACRLLSIGFNPNTMTPLYIAHQ